MGYGTYQTGTINPYDSMYGSANDVQGFGIGNAPIINSKPFPTFDKPSPAPNTTITYNPPVGPVGDVPLTTRPFPNLQGPKPRPTGNLSFSFGGGGGGGGGPSIPSNVLNTRQFAPYKNTWTPPAAVTPEPYDWATRDPYIYGNGLSNAGAAYDIWGSKPGENPYVMTTPSDYTPGLLGMQPVTLPDNVPSTNVGGGPSGPTNPRKKFTGTPEQIVRDYGYYDRTAPMQNNVPPSMRDSAPNAQVMLDAARINWKKGHYPSMQAAMDAQVAFSKKYPAKTPAENAALIAASQKMLLSQDQRPKKEKKITRISNIPVAGTGASGPPGRGSTKPITIATKKSIDTLISTTKSRGGTSKNYFNDKRITGGR
jgi:hypothetical protein